MFTFYYQMIINHDLYRCQLVETTVTKQKEIYNNSFGAP